MKEQNKELKLNKKKLEKLEEKFIKVSGENKALLNDKTNIEAFLKNIFSKDMHDELFKTDIGTYDSSELSRLWLIGESKNQNEYQTILSKLKKEISDLTEKNTSINSYLEEITEEYTKYKSEQKNNNEQLLFYSSRYTDVTLKLENLEKEKVYLLKVLDEKNSEIEILNALELENAELKAKSLLDNIDVSVPIIEPSSPLDNFKYINKTASNHLNEKAQLKIRCQTDEDIYSKNEVDDLKEQINNLQLKNIKMKKEFSDYKEKSHKIFLSNEENYNKTLNEYETVKKELSQLLNQHNNESMIATNNLLMKSKINNALQQKGSELILQEFEKHGDLAQKISLEYLKNILLKYLEAISIGNEFQSKLLENVMFTMLAVSNNEKRRLEEKRATSSFYYNLWFNAKAYLSSKIYGNNNLEDSKVSEMQGEVTTNEDNYINDTSTSHLQRHNINT